MYEKYNAVLRFHAAKNDDGSVRTEHPSADAVPFLQKKCSELGLGEWTPTANGGVRWQWHNKYATTIHAINSVVVKMSRLTKVAPLYRGAPRSTRPRRPPPPRPRVPDQRFRQYLAHCLTQPTACLPRRASLEHRLHSCDHRTHACLRASRGAAPRRAGGERARERPGFPPCPADAARTRRWLM